MKETKKFAFCFLIMFILLVSTGQIRVDLATDNYLSFLIFLFATYIHLRIDKGKATKKIFTFYIISFFVLNIIVRFIEGWKHGLISVPNFIFILLGIISGYLIYAGTSGRRFILPTIFFMLALCQAFIFHPYWINYVNYRNFTGHTNENLNRFDWTFRNEEGKVFTKSDYQNKVVLLDFWNTGCGVCFAKFPLLERIHKMYQGNDSVIIQAVNIPMERDSNGMAFNLIKKKNFSFPVVIGENNADSTWRVNSYPTTVVFFNDKIVYRGDIEKAEDAITALLNKK